jgi:hypothetical protein
VFRLHRTSSVRASTVSVSHHTRSRTVSASRRTVPPVAVPRPTYLNGHPDSNGHSDPNGHLGA